MQAELNVVARPIYQAGVSKSIVDLKDSNDRFRSSTIITQNRSWK